MESSILNINNYVLTEPLSNKNAGLSVWGIGSRNGKQYFLKSFLSPKYPLDENGNVQSEKKAAIRNCETFEAAKTQLYRALHEANIADGNLVEIHQFFRSGTKYYISTEAIQEENLSVLQIAALSWDRKLEICYSLAHSFAALEAQKIVHADVKPTNIFIAWNGKLRARVIDFDAGFLEENAPKPGEELNGDQVYMSPEACLCMCGEEAKVTCKTDVFALGILFHEYLTGRRPGFDQSIYDTIHEAVMDGAEISMYTGNAEIDRMLTRMLKLDPVYRPDAAEVMNFFREELRKASGTSGPGAAGNYAGGLMNTAGNL